MDTHIKKPFKQNMQALRMAKPIIDAESRVQIKKLLANGDSASRHLVHVLYGIEYKDMKEFK